jgi:Zn-dependent protease
VTIAALAIGLLLHELAHVAVALGVGDETPRWCGRWTLNPLAHVHPLGTIALPVGLWLAGLPLVGFGKPVPLGKDLSHAEAILVFAAGPVMNLQLAWMAFLLCLLWPPLLVFAQVNLVLAAFNLLPLPWLDGGRILRTFLRAVV